MVTEEESQCVIISGESGAGLPADARGPGFTMPHDSNTGTGDLHLNPQWRAFRVRAPESVSQPGVAPVDILRSLRACVSA